MVSSISPLSVPSVACWARKPSRVRLTIQRLRVIVSSTVEPMLSKARCQLSQSMAAATPIRLRTPESNCVTLSLSTRLMFSTSLVSRLMVSPCARWSKKRSGSACSLAKRSLRRSRTVRWAAPAMT